VESYVPPDPGPYPEDKPRTNTVRFTPVQVEAIMSGACTCAVVCAHVSKEGRGCAAQHRACTSWLLPPRPAPWILFAPADWCDLHVPTPPPTSYSGPQVTPPHPNPPP